VTKVSRCMVHTSEFFQYNAFTDPYDFLQHHTFAFMILEFCNLVMLLPGCTYWNLNFIKMCSATC
jgi:hypothetical protein